MNVTLPFGSQETVVEIDEERMDARVVRAANPASQQTWAEVVTAAMAAPLSPRAVDLPDLSAGRSGMAPLAEQDLQGKRIAIIVDDRVPHVMPADELVPLILDAVAKAEAADEDVTLVMARGIDEPLSHDELAQALGSDVVERCRCISHDAGDREMLRLIGVSRLGTPVWANRYAVEADYVIGLGRVTPHPTHGYEGGYRLILPGVCGFETILRDQSLCFSPDAVPGIHANPSRRETDAVGRMVGIDFLINVVVNASGEPLRAFAGAAETVHHHAIAYGDREVWGAPIGHSVDITLASHGSGPVPEGGFDPETVRRACHVTKSEGTVIILAEKSSPTLPDWRAGDVADDAALEALALEDFERRMRDLAFSELLRLHERRDWSGGARDVQKRLRAIRDEFQRRRWLMAAEAVRLVFTQDPQMALEAGLARHGGRPRVLILPEGETTLPKMALHTGPA